MALGDPLTPVAEWHAPLTLLQRAVFYFLSLCAGAMAALLATRVINRGVVVVVDEEKAAAVGAAAHGSVRTQWLGRSRAEWVDVLRHVLSLGGVLCFAYVAEHTPLLARIDKTYSGDFFLFGAGLLLVAALATVRKSRGSEVLNRDQSEEWKGWMQFLFVMYHQQQAAKAYNLIRIFVSSYVWMTGFGNFSFFYVRGDYSFNRLLQMLWRLNFLVLAIMAVMGTNYILYYIVPLHTFYFLVVYATMGVAQSLNYTEWGVRAKIFAVGVCIYVVWELEQAVPGVFDTVFAPLSPILAEKNWSLHEWHFRTFLDHYSSLFGMAFAMNFPYLLAWFAAVERMPSLAARVALKSAVGALWLAASYWWYTDIYTLPKYEFNAAHPYWFWIPIMTFVYFRNLTPTLRSYHSALLNWLGKITLETYLLQFHIFMVAKNADGSWAPKKLLSLVPEYPLVNMLVCGLVYVACAKISFNATLSLRDACIGDLTPREMLRKLPYALGAVAALLALAFVFHFNDDFLLLFMALLSVAAFLGVFSLDLQ
jgi:hypothetical protein